MNIDSFVSCGFLFTFPIWIIGRQGSNGLEPLKADGQAGEKAVPIFTDRDLAQACIETLPSPGTCVLRPIDDVMCLLGCLVVLETKGYTHVLIDHSRKSTLPIPIGILRSDAIHWFD
jgi:hypothetical protein